MRILQIFFLFVIFATLPAFGQNSPEKVKKILVTGNQLIHDASMGDNVQLILGNVVITHGNVIMYCDSAYQYNDSNRVEAYNNIHIIQNDSIHLYGDFLDYEGNIGLVKIRRNVRLTKKEMVLTTDFLDYDRNKDFAYYYDGGKIVDGGNVLTSKLGYFYSNNNEVFFKDSVVAENKRYTIFSDTLMYNTTSKVTKILGPTFIVGEDNLIYSEDGYYDTSNDISNLRKNSYIEGENTLLKGDTIYYDRKSGFGEVFGNMELIDTANNITIKGDYGYYNELTKKAFAIKKATLLQVYHGDTLFLHADTLRIDPVEDTITNTDNKLLRAYHHVKFFRHDMQGRCDSMVYDFRDSINIFYKEPVLWAMGNQMTAQVIKLYSRNQTIYKAKLENGAFIIAPDDTLFFNQLKGKDMVGYIKDNSLYKIEVEGNAQTIYYPRNNGLVIGANKAESSDMTIHLDHGKIDDIIMRKSPNGTLKPPTFLTEEESSLTGFRWLEDYRPKNKMDIYIKNELPKNEEVTNIYEGFQIEDINTVVPTKNKK